jgi:hypothetical protein
MLNVGIVRPGDIDAGDEQISGINWTNYAIAVNAELRAKRFFEEFLPEELIPVRDEIVFFFRHAGWSVELTPCDDLYFLTIRYKKPAAQVVPSQATPAPTAAPVPTVVQADDNQGQGDAQAKTGDANEGPHSVTQDEPAEPAPAHTCQDGDFPCVACSQGRACLGSPELTPTSNGDSAVSTRATVGATSEGGVSPQVAATTVATAVLERFRQLQPGQAIVVSSAEGDPNNEEKWELTVEARPEAIAQRTQESSGVPYTTIAGLVTAAFIIAMGVAVVLLGRLL